MAVEDITAPEPLYPDQTEEAIRARWNAWANEGRSVDDVDGWTDTREGSFFQVTTEGGVRESARIYDLMGTEVPAAASPLWAWESYLDDHAEVVDVDRHAATFAEGIVTFTGPADVEVPEGTTVGVEPSDPDAEGLEYETTETGVIPLAGFALIPVRAREAGAAGNVSIGAVTQLITPLADDTVSVSNPVAITGGTDTEDDPRLRVRVLDRYVPQGPGVRADYVRWALEEPEVGRVTVLPLWAGPGTVLVVIMDEDGQPLGAPVVDRHQARLDPNPGKGDGLAPIGAHATVTTATALAIKVDATVEFEDGYSLDGAGGTIALGAAITSAVTLYVESVPSGGEVVRSQVIRAIASVRGVHDVLLSSVELNDATVNVAVPSSPARVPQISSVNLTAGTF